jgi:hypothetical protein
LPSSIKLTNTTIADPATPRKNITSSSRIPRIANTMKSILPQPNVLHSPLYAVIVEVVGRRRSFRRSA